MRAIGRFDPAVSRVRGHAESASTKTEWMDHGSGPGLAPNVWLVRMPPGEAIGTHFHTQNQFQLFVEGSGRIGQREVGPVTAHYAGAFSGYGPLVAGDRGLAYFTVRARHDPGAQHLPEARSQQAPGPRRVWTGPVMARRPDDAPFERSELAFEQAHDDGMRIEVHTIAPGDRLSVAATAEGLFACVLAGQVREGDAVLDRLEWLFVTPQEDISLIATSPSGAEVILLHMPLLAGAYRLSQAA
jgi:hypothetical protein